MNRPKYKQLYLEEKAKVEELRYDLEDLKEIKAILEPEGAALGEYLRTVVRPETMAFNLSPLGRKALEVWFHSMMRYTVRRLDGGFRAITFEGIPVYATEGRLLKEDWNV